MTIYLIVSMYQGVYEGIELASLDLGEVRVRYRALVQETLGPRAIDLPWHEIEEMYENELEHDGAVEVYFLDQVEVV